MPHELTDDDVALLHRLHGQLRLSSDPHISDTMGWNRADQLRQAADRIEAEDADVRAFRALLRRLGKTKSTDKRGGR